MHTHAIVLVTLANPRQKQWGQLLAINPGGVTVRAVELNSFEDFLSQITESAAGTVPFPTSFFPMHRVERIALDERIGEIPALAERFHQRLGITIEKYLARFDPAGTDNQE